MALTYSEELFDGKEISLAAKLNQYFNDIQTKFDGNITNDDIAADANIAGSKIDTSSQKVGIISQVNNLASDATPSALLQNAGNAGVISIKNLGSGEDIFTNDGILRFDLDNDADQTGEAFNVTKHNGAETVFSAQSDGSLIFPLATHHDIITAASFFGPTDQVIGDSTMIIDDDGVFFEDNSTSAVQFIGRFHLPENAVLQKITAFVRKQNTGATATISIQSVSFAGATISTLASVDISALASSASFASVSTATISSATIANQTLRYHISAQLNNAVALDVAIAGVRLEYTLDRT